MFTAQIADGISGLGSASDRSGRRKYRECRGIAKGVRKQNSLAQKSDAHNTLTKRHIFCCASHPDQGISSGDSSGQAMSKTVRTGNSTPGCSIWSRPSRPTCTMRAFQNAGRHPLPAVDVHRTPEKVHLAMEDKSLYPALLKSPDAKLRTMAQKFIDEMGAIGGVLRPTKKPGRRLKSSGTTEPKFIADTSLC